MSKKTRYFVVVSGAILLLGMGTGLLASYLGLPVSVFSNAAGPDELQYVPADASVVAYANVRDVMNSEFRQRFRQLEPQSAERHEFEERTGINLEQDVESVVAAMTPGEAPNHPEHGALLLARGRFQAERLEALALEHGATVDVYEGTRIVSHEGSRDGGNGRMALGFIEADLVAFGTDLMVHRAIDAHRDNRNVVSNNDMMRLIAELGNSNAWAVGRFDEVAKQANLPTEIQGQMPTISWFSAAGHINGGLNGVIKAEAKDDASAQNLRDVVRGFLALAKLQAGNKPGMQQMVDSLQLSGDGTTVALAFSVPTEVLDVLETAMKMRKNPAEK